jgi:PadR family transcriptional regulator, regulatory protein PadR
MTAPTIKVIGAILSSSADELAGSEIARATKLPSGTLYPILFRLEKAGWLESRWEVERAQELGRPRRRLYRVTGLGASNARTAFNELEPALGRAQWA